MAQITLPVSFTSTSSYMGVLGETWTYGNNQYTILYKKISTSKIQINSPYDNPCGWYLKGY